MKSRKSKSKSLSAQQEPEKYMATPFTKKAPPTNTQLSYQPLEMWPSDGDRADSDELERICAKLEEAEDYIQQLNGEAAA